MREFRKKQKRLKKIMNTVVIITAVFIFVYYGIEPSLVSWLGQGAAMAIMYAMYGFVLASLVLVFQYSSRYGKSDKFLEAIEYELSDAGYYLSARAENSIDAYNKAVLDDLVSNGFAVKYNEVVNDFELDEVCTKGKDLFYIVKLSSPDKNDVVAYLDSVTYDITAVNVRRRANAVLLFICDNADEGAVALSKMITPLGKKEQIKIAIAIAEVSTGRVYFLGNRVTKCQQMIAGYVMNCSVPISSEYVYDGKLDFQDDLEEHMKEFNIKDFKNGTFFAH